MSLPKLVAFLVCWLSAALSVSASPTPLRPFQLSEEEKGRLDKWEQELDRLAQDLVSQKRWEFYYVFGERSSDTPGVSCDTTPKQVTAPKVDVRWRLAQTRIDAAARRFNERLALEMRKAGDDSCPIEDALSIWGGRLKELSATPAVCPVGPQPDVSAAVRNGCPSEVKRLISSGAKIDWRDASNLDGLSWAIIRGDVNVASMLLSAGASPNRRPQERSIPPLALASHLKRFEIAKELLRRGATVNAELRTGGPSNALDYAARSGDVATMRLLVDAGAPIEAQGQDSNGPLVWAAWSGNVAAIQYLLGKGADANRRIFVPTLPAYISALEAAIGARNADIVKVLLKSGADPNLEVDNYGNTPLHRASYWQSKYEVVEALVEAGAKVEAVNQSERTPLRSVLGDWTWHSDQTRIVKLFLSKGADVNRPNNFGETPLMLAAVKCPPNSELVKTLLGAGANKRARDPKGRTALARFRAKKNCPADRRATDQELRAIEKLLSTR